MKLNTQAYIKCQSVLLSHSSKFLISTWYDTVSQGVWIYLNLVQCLVVHLSIFKANRTSLTSRLDIQIHYRLGKSLSHTVGLLYLQSTPLVANSFGRCIPCQRNHQKYLTVTCQKITRQVPPTYVRASALDSPAFTTLPFSIVQRLLLLSLQLMRRRHLFQLYRLVNVVIGQIVLMMYNICLTVSQRS